MSRRRRIARLIRKLADQIDDRQLNSEVLIGAALLAKLIPDAVFTTRVTTINTPYGEAGGRFTITHYPPHAFGQK